MSKCETIIEKLEDMMYDYEKLINYVGDIDLYRSKKQEFLARYFNKYNNAKEWYYKLKYLDNCFTPYQIRQFADLFQQLQTGDNFTFMASDSEIRQLQRGRRCKYEKIDDKKGCINGDTCRDHSIKHRIEYVHDCGPVWVLYISQLINNLVSKLPNKKRRIGAGTRKRLYHKSSKHLHKKPCKKLGKKLGKKVCKKKHTRKKKKRKKEN